MTSTDHDGQRPLKHQRTDPPPVLSSIPPAKLLLALPSLVLHPPTHKRHLQSVALAQRALRQCLALEGLDPIDECRAWTGLAELCLRRMDSTAPIDEPEVEKAITKALLLAYKYPALRLYSPYLTILSARLAQYHQHNARFAQHSLKRLLTQGISAKDPPHVVFSAHLEMIRSLEAEADATLSTPRSFPSTGISPPLAKCLGAINDLQDLCLHSSSSRLMGLLVLLIRLQVLITHGIWVRAREALKATEEAFEAYDALASLNTQPTSQPPPGLPSSPISMEHPSPARKPSLPPIPPHLRVHLLVLSAVAYTHFGEAALAWQRILVLHSMADSGVLNVPFGVIQIPFGPTESSTNDTYPPLYISGTHPRVLYILTCLVSAIVKRDAIGRKPKKKLFANEGLAVVRAEIGSGEGPLMGEMGRTEDRMQGIHWGVVGGKEVVLPAESTLADVARVKRRMVLMKADLLAEVVHASIMRSEFDEAQNTLNELVAHLRTHSIFPLYAARVVFMNAQLAHALGKPLKARECYEVAAWLASGCSHTNDGKKIGENGEEGYRRDEWLRVAARAGEVWVRIGMVRSKGAEERKKARVVDGDPRRIVGGSGDGVDDVEKELRQLRVMAKEVVGECRALGGTLEAVGEIIRACLCDEILRAKHYLRDALTIATRAGDDHLRALILALSSSHYLHTAKETAHMMLQACDTIAAGFGAEVKEKEKHRDREKEGYSSQEAARGLGNLKMRVWVGERFVELYRSIGETGKADKQQCVNRVLRDALGTVEAKGSTRGL